jgi:hypothetical protein
MPIQPDSYPGDPYGHIVNQCSHAMLGVFLAVFWACLSTWWPVPVVAGVAYYLAVEVAQGWSWDGVQDAAYVGAGAALPPAIMQGPWVAAGLMAVGLAALVWGGIRRL